MQAGGRPHATAGARALQASRVPARTSLRPLAVGLRDRSRHHGAAVLSAAGRGAARDRAARRGSWSLWRRPGLVDRLAAGINPGARRPGRDARGIAGLGRRFGGLGARSAARARAGSAARRSFCRGARDGGGGRPRFGAAPAGVVSARRLCRGTGHGDGRPRHARGGQQAVLRPAFISRPGSTRRRLRLRSCCCRRALR